MAPGLRVVAYDGVVEVVEEPRGHSLGRIALEGVRAVWALPDGRAVADVPGDTLALWDGRAWSRVPRPDGELVRYGGQLRTKDREGGVALDTAGAWRVSGTGSGDDVRWWTEQLDGGGRPVDVGASHLDSGYPPPPVAPVLAPVTAASVRKKSLVLQLIGTSGDTQGADAVNDILGDEASTRGATWRIAPRDDWREWFPRLRLLSDGVREGKRWTRLPHVLFAPRDAPVQLLEVPVDCVPTWADARAGLGLLRCEDGSIYARGATWMREIVAPGTSLITGDDGTLLAVKGETAWVRAPEAPGAAWARIEHPGVTAWRPGPAGTALAVTLSATEFAVDVYDAGGHRGRRAAPLLAQDEPGEGVPFGWLDVQVNPEGLAVVRWQVERGEAHTAVVYRFAP